MNIEIKKSEIAGEFAKLQAYKSPSGDVVFRVTNGKNESECVASFREFAMFDEAFRYYEDVKRELGQKAYSLFESLCHCRDKGYTPHETADYLFNQGYSK